VIFHLVAAAAAGLFAWRFITSDWLVRIAMLVAIPFGAWAIIIAEQQPWGEARGRILRPFASGILTAYVGSSAVGLDGLNSIVVGVFFGFASCTVVQGLRAGRLQLFGMWPTR